MYQRKRESGEPGEHRSERARTLVCRSLSGLGLVGLLMLGGAATVTSDDAGFASDPSIGPGFSNGPGFEPQLVETRINAGGGAYTDEYGDTFAADQPWAPGGFGYVGGITGQSSAPVAGTLDDPLYQVARGGASFSYLFDGLPSGLYEVRLFFNEAWQTSKGFREFEVLAEGQVALDHYDAFFFCGSPSARWRPHVGNYRACSQNFDVQVTDGQLNLDFEVQVGINAFVAAIAVREKRSATVAIAAYEEVAASVGITHHNSFDQGECLQSIGTGSAWADFNGDQLIDLYVTSHKGSNRLYRNDGDTNGDELPDFTDVAGPMGAADADGWSHGAVFIDYDNDGDQDLYVTDWDGNLLLENQLTETGTASFVDRTAFAGVANAGRAVTSAWGDFDGDGDLDFYLAKHAKCMAPLIQESEDALYRNNGNGTFTDVTDWLCPAGTAPCEQTTGLGFSAAWVDYDNDVDLDLYLVNDNVSEDFYHNVLWRNDGPGGGGTWNFTDVSASSGADADVNGMGLAVGDYDNDRDFDFAFSNISPNNLVLNNGDGTFRQVSAGAGVQRGYDQGVTDPMGSENFTWGTAFFDHDNDGWLDVFFAGGHLNDDRELIPGGFFWNQRDGTFQEMTAESGLGAKGRVRNISIADFDTDGFPDIFMNNYPDRGLGPHGTGGAFWLYHNKARELGNERYWLKVTVEGTTSNRDGIGTRIWIRTDDKVIQMREISSGPSHGGGDERAALFGTRNDDRVVMRVRWPDGQIQNFHKVEANQHIHLVQP